MKTIDAENINELLQDIYQRLMIDADDVGLAPDDILQYVQEFEMDEDQLFSFIKDKISEKKENKDIKEAYYVSFIKKYNKNNKFF
jgi:UV DNA damage repair endonuclease